MTDAPFSYSTKIDGDIYSLRSKEGETQEQFLGRALLFKSILPKPSAPKAETGGTPERKPSGTEKSFGVVSIKLAAGGDHPRWVVKGGSFTKYGVTAWPEVLEAAGIAEKLDPLKDNTPSGKWTDRKST